MILENDEKFLWQWNMGKKVLLQDEEEAKGITWASLSVNNHEAVLQPASDGVIEIPDLLLQNPGNLYVYLHIGTPETLTTVGVHAFCIRMQPRPNDYTEPSEVLRWHQLDDRITALEQSGGSNGGLTPEQEKKLGEIDGKVSKTGHAANQYLGTDEKGNVIEKPAPSGDAGAADLTEYMKTSEANTIFVRQTVLDSMTAVETGDGNNVLPPDSEAGYWKAEKGAAPLPVDAAGYGRTPIPFDVSEIPVTGNTRLMYLNVQNAVAGTQISVIMLDSNGKSLGSSNSQVFPKEIYAPADCVKCLFWFNKAAQGNTMKQFCISEKNEYSEYVPHTGKRYIKAENIDPRFRSTPVAGKNVICFGDSLFGMYLGKTSATEYLAETCGCTVYNVGFSGCKMSAGDTYQPYQEAFAMYQLADAAVSRNWSEQEAQLASAPEYFASQLNVLKSVDFTKMDYAVIHYGTNDFSVGSTLDHAENPMDVHTICGALRYSVETIQKQYPQIQIYVSLPCYRTGCEKPNTRGLALSAIAAGIAAAAREYNLPVLDSFHGLNINAANADTYLEDGLHHNQAGRQRFGTFLGQCLASGTDGFGFYGTGTGEGISRTDAKAMIESAIGGAMGGTY